MLCLQLHLCILNTAPHQPNNLISPTQHKQKTKLSSSSLPPSIQSRIEPPNTKTSKSPPAKHHHPGNSAPSAPAPRKTPRGRNSTPWPKSQDRMEPAGFPPNQIPQPNPPLSLTHHPSPPTNKQSGAAKKKKTRKSPVGRAAMQKNEAQSSYFINSMSKVRTSHITHHTSTAKPKKKSTDPSTVSERNIYVCQGNTLRNQTNTEANRLLYGLPPPPPYFHRGVFPK